MCNSALKKKIDVCIVWLIYNQTGCLHSNWLMCTSYERDVHPINELARTHTKTSEKIIEKRKNELLEMNFCQR